MKSSLSTVKLEGINIEHIIIQTAMGKIALYYQRKPFKVWRTEFPGIHPFDHESPQNNLFSELSFVVNLIQDYFNGVPFDTPWKILELGSLTRLQQDVLAKTAQIPFGTVTTYRQVALSVNRPKACRFVGNTLAINPFPILIPCHRVIRSDGKIGKFGGGTPLKNWLINMERALI